MIALISVVRDEADIVSDMVAHHRRAGVDAFYFADHQSQDGTRDLIAEWTLIDVEGLYLQAKWKLQLARQAIDDGADWIVVCDADQFYVGDLAAVLDEVPDTVGIIDVPRWDMVGHIDDDLAAPWQRRMIWLDVAQRPVMAQMAPYNPQTVFRSRLIASDRLRIGRGFGVSGITGIHDRTARHPLRLLHFPYRSPAQIESKFANALDGYQTITPRVGAAKRHLASVHHSDGVSFWRAMQATDETIADGRYVEDTTLRDAR